MSKDVYKSIEYLVSKGYVEVVKPGGDEVKLYAITDSGAREAKRVIEREKREVEKLVRTVSRLGSIPASLLAIYVHKKFPEYVKRLFD